MAGARYSVILELHPNGGARWYLDMINFCPARIELPIAAYFAMKTGSWHGWAVAALTLGLIPPFVSILGHHD
jgi:hypothetical protein